MCNIFLCNINSVNILYAHLCVVMFETSDYRQLVQSKPSRPYVNHVYGPYRESNTTRPEETNWYNWLMYTLWLPYCSLWSLCEGLGLTLNFTTIILSKSWKPNNGLDYEGGYGLLDISPSYLHCSRWWRWWWCLSSI